MDQTRCFTSTRRSIPHYMRKEKDVQSFLVQALIPETQALKPFYTLLSLTSLNSVENPCSPSLNLAKTIFLMKKSLFLCFFQRENPSRKRKKKSTPNVSYLKYGDI